MKTILTETRKLDSYGIDAVSQQIAETLSDYPYLTRRDILRLQLSAEEILLHWMAEPGEKSVQLVIEEKGRWLDLTLLLNGVSHQIAPVDADAAFRISTVDGMLANLGLDWIYQYDRDQNSAYISVEAKKSRRLQYVFTAIALAILTSVLVRMLPEAVGAGLQDHIVHPLLEVCSRFLTAIVSPMMLLAVVSGVLSVGTPRSLNRVGRLVCIRFLLGMILTVACAGALCALCFPFSLKAAGDTSSGFLSFLTGIVPSDVLTPLIEGNILQIVFLGVIIGIAMLFLQRRVGITNRVIEELSAIILKILTGFEKAIPAFVFLSLFDTGLGIDMESLAAYGKLLVLFVLFLAAVVLVQLCYTSRRIGIDLRTVWQTLRPTFMAQLSSACSSSAFTEAYDACEKGFGVDSKLVGFALPIGTIIHKPLIAAEFVFVISAIQGMTGGSMDPFSMVILMLVAIIVSMAYPPISGGEISCYTILLLQMGMNANLLAVACTLSALFDMLEAPGNTLCTELQLLLTAYKHDRMDSGKAAAPQSK